MELKIEYVSTDKLKPYKNNAKKHPAEQVEQIKASIQEFGFLDPIAIWKGNEVIAGHGRLIAAKELGIDTVPVIRLNRLTDDKRKAYALVHNKLTMNSGFDVDLLDLELDDILDIDMTAFGFDMDLGGYEPDYSEITQNRADNILGLGNGQFPGAGYYDIPIIEGTKKVPKVREWIGFNYVLSDNDPEGKGVHFFVDDYQFERVWNDPDKYVEKLKQYRAVLAPDFSPYGDMPLVCQLWNHYRKHWCAAYWQENEITVIPTIRASADLRSLDWYLEGEPEESVVAISTMWASRIPKEMKTEYDTMIERLRPCHIIVYGDVLEYMDKSIVTHIPKFTETRFKFS